MKNVAIQGYAASFHDVAARQMLGKNITILPFDTFLSVFKAVASQEAEYGVVAITNTIYGPVTESLNLFDRFNVRILYTTEVAIEQCLLVLPGAASADIDRVYSHPIALAQCKKYVAKQLPHAQLVGHTDTAGAAADVAASGDKHAAAIAGRAAAKLYGLDVLAANIQSDKHNITTFVAFTKD